MVSAVTLSEVLAKSHTRPASSLETILRSKKHASKRTHKLVVRPNAKSFLERWRNKDRMVREDAINDTSLDLSLKQQARKSAFIEIAKRFLVSVLHQGNDHEAFGSFYHLSSASYPKRSKHVTASKYGIRNIVMMHVSSYFR